MQNVPKHAFNHRAAWRHWALKILCGKCVRSELSLDRVKDGLRFSLGMQNITGLAHVVLVRGRFAFVAPAPQWQEGSQSPTPRNSAATCIEPSAPPKEGIKSRTLRDRLLNHCRDALATSTLRRTLAALLRVDECPLIAAELWPLGDPQAVVAKPPPTGMTAPQTKPLAFEAR